MITITNIKAGQPDANGRVYPREVLEKGVADLNKKIAAGEIISIGYHKNLNVDDPPTALKSEDRIGLAHGFTLTEDGAIQLEYTLLTNAPMRAVVQQGLETGVLILAPLAFIMLKPGADDTQMVTDLEIIRFDCIDPALRTKFTMQGHI